MDESAGIGRGCPNLAALSSLRFNLEGESRFAVEDSCSCVSCCVEETSSDMQ